MSDSGGTVQKKIKLVENDESHQKETGDGKESSKKSHTAFKSPLTDSMLPPETWDHIFSSLSSNDFLSVINVCMEWNKLLDSRKISELFALVFPHLLPYLTANEILGCRQVIKSWQAAVDLALQTIWTSSETATNFPHGRTTQLYSTVEGLSKNYVFGPNLEPQLIQFMGALNLQGRDPQPRNPFLTRSLEVEWPAERVGHQPDFRHRLRNMLFRYGNHLWRLNYKLDQLFNVAILSEYLSFLPRLKILEISDDYWANHNFRGVLRQRLPNLSNLEHLDATGLRQHSFTSSFVEWYGPHLSFLAVRASWFGATQLQNEALSFLLPNLKKLQLIDVVPSTLSTLSQMDWLLETLQLKLRAFENKSRLDKIQLIMETVSKFKDSLITLEIHVEKAPDTGFEEDILTLSNLAFAELSKLEKFVFWTKKDNQDFSKSVMKRNNLK